jgi:uncharacterized protein (DUF1778 family)
MAAKTERIEMRTDPDSGARIAQAAAAVKQTISAFVLAAATREADRVLARAHHTVMAEDQFDRLVATLDTPDLAPNLERAAARERRFTRR